MKLCGVLDHIMEMCILSGILFWPIFVQDMNVWTQTFFTNVCISASSTPPTKELYTILPIDQTTSVNLRISVVFNMQCAPRGVLVPIGQFQLGLSTFLWKVLLLLFCLLGLSTFLWKVLLLLFCFLLLLGLSTFLWKVLLLLFCFLLLLLLLFFCRQKKFSFQDLSKDFIVHHIGHLEK